MIAQFIGKPGQSIYDLCLQCYQSLDLVVKFAVDNGITDFTNVPQKVYYYDTTKVKNKGVQNYPFTTDSNFSNGNGRFFGDEFGLDFS